MKKISAVKVLLASLLVLASSKSFSQLPSLFNFSNTPDIVSGTNKALNSVYRYHNVSVGTDALVTVVSFSGGATIQDLDNKSSADPIAFSPIIRIPKNSTGIVEFKIDFVIAGTTISRPMDSLMATVWNVDGDDKTKEFAVLNLNGGSSSYMSATPEIAITNSGSNFTATNIGGVTHGFPDLNAAAVAYNVKNKNVTSIIYKIGGVNNGNEDSRKQSLTLNYSSIAAAVLPVKYISFDGVINNQNVVLKWITSEEINNSHFEVEHSFDMNTFTTVGLVMDGFNNGSNKSYQFKEAVSALNNNTVVYYRLKQFDLDGRFTYSKVIAVRLQAGASAAQMQVSPNPFVENIAVQYAALENGSATIQVLSAAGITAMSKQASITKGNNNLKLDGLNNLSSGLYIARLVVDGQVVSSVKIIKN